MLLSSQGMGSGPAQEEWPHSCPDPLASSCRRILTFCNSPQSNSPPWFNIFFLHRLKQIIQRFFWSLAKPMTQTNTVFGIHLALCGLALGCKISFWFSNGCFSAQWSNMEQTYNYWILPFLQVQSVSIRNQTLENLIPSASLSELLLQLTAWEGFRRRASELLKIHKLTGDHGCRPSQLLPHSERHHTVSVYTSLDITLGVLNSKGSLDKRVKNTVTGQTLFRWPAQEE